MGRHINISERLELTYQPVEDEFIPENDIEDLKTVICAHFACPVKLTRTQSLCSNFCPKHQGNKFDVTKVFSYPIKYKK